MPEQTFDALRTELLESGIASRHVKRIISELSDHLEDIEIELQERGKTKAEAREIALGRIGDQKLIAGRMLETTELRTWIYRYPRVARVYLPIAYALLLPAAPVFAGLANPGKVFRWGAALMLSAGVTAGMLLFMQLAIVLT